METDSLDRQRAQDGSASKSSSGTNGQQDALGPAVAGGTMVAVGLLGRRLGRVARVALTAGGGYLAGKAALGSEQTRRTLGLGAAHAGGGSRDVRATATVQATPEEVYGRWRRFADLPRWMTHLESVTDLGDGRSRWRAKAPLGTEVSWDAELTEDRPGDVIAWRSLPGASIANEGRVRFVPAPGGRGTEVHVELSYAPPAGALGVAAAKLTGEEPNTQVRDALRRFKQILETGEAATTEGQPSGRAPAQASDGSTSMSEQSIPEKGQDGKTASAVRPEVVRTSDVTPGTEVANLPHSADTVAEASEDSFPASDPPAYTGRRDDRLDPTTDVNA